METSISMRTTSQSGVKNTTTLSNVNPDASNGTLKQYAQKLAELTTDTLSGATKITKQNLDDEPDKASRTISAYLLDSETWESITGTITSALNFNTIPAVDSTKTEDNGVDTSILIKYEGDNTTDLEFTFKRDDQAARPLIGIAGYYDAGQSSELKGRIFTLNRYSANSTMQSGKTFEISLHAPEDDTYLAADFTITLQGGNG